MNSYGIQQSNNPVGADYLEGLVMIQKLLAAAQPERYLPRFIVNAVLSESLIFPLDSKNDRNASNR